LTEQDVEAFTAEFTRTGFRGGLNWYRNIDWMWELTPFLNGAKRIAGFFGNGSNRRFWFDGTVPGDNFDNSRSP
jgi:hypothetical protein